MSQPYQLLIIGGPNAGKTHFVGQLYNRLFSNRQPGKGSAYRMVTPPADLSAIKAVIDRLACGLSGLHTESGLNEEISFVVANEQRQVTLTFPDYGGEQVRDLVRDRLVSSRWQELIAQSDEWLLLIRPDEIQSLEDITTRGFADLADLRRRAAKARDEATLTPPAFYVELLQMLLFIKGRSVVAPVSQPRLTVALSCWDTLDLPSDGVKPPVELRQRLALLASFLEATWQPGSWRVCGLSSLGQTLSSDVANEDFVDNGPENAGYVVLPSGEYTPDLTQLIAL
jgi:GTPase SAR1 family protein